MNNWLDVLNQWSDYILKYVELPDEDDQLIRVPHHLASLMKIDSDKLDEDMVTVIGGEYKNALFSQGHVTNYILFLTILGEPYLKLRNYLIQKQFEYVTIHLESFKEWQNVQWINELLNGSVTMNAVLPLMTKWLYADTNQLETRKYQHILPLYLLRGEYTVVPSGLRVSRFAYNGMIISTCHIGDNTWYENICDVSLARIAFFDIVKQADQIFYIHPRPIKICGVPVMFKYDRKNVPSEKLIERAGNLLSFGAYITLLSKYARYSLPLGDTKLLIQKEKQFYLGKLQSQLFAYNPERTNYGRKEDRGIEFLQERSNQGGDRFHRKGIQQESVSTQGSSSSDR